jgi:hypothetical protein
MGNLAWPAIITSTLNFTAKISLAFVYSIKTQPLLIMTHLYPIVLSTTSAYKTGTLIVSGFAQCARFRLTTKPVLILHRLPITTALVAPPLAPHPFPIPVLCLFHQVLPPATPRLSPFHLPLTEPIPRPPLLLIAPVFHQTSNTTPSMWNPHLSLVQCPAYV